MQLYRHFNKTHVVPNLGARKLTELTPLLMEQTLAKMAANGGSVDIRRKFVGFLRSALRRAVAWDLMQKNPMDAVSKPREGRKEMRFLTRPEIIRFLEAAERHHLFGLYVLAIATGLRQGELFGLQVDDVDLVRGRLNVRRSLAEVGGVLILQEPKTRRSSRRVDLDRQTIEVLREHMEQNPSPARGAGAGYVFTSAEGLPLRKSNVIRRSFASTLKEAKLGKVRFHDLRHTHASILLAEGVHPKVVAERLGHSSIGMTLDRYSHTIPTMQEDAVLKLGVFFALPAPSKKIDAVALSASTTAVDSENGVAPPAVAKTRFKKKRSVKAEKVRREDSPRRAHRRQLVPKGWYLVCVDAVERKPTEQGEQVVVRFKIIDGNEIGRKPVIHLQTIHPKLRIARAGSDAITGVEVAAGVSRIEDAKGKQLRVSLASWHGEARLIAAAPAMPLNPADGSPGSVPSADRIRGVSALVDVTPFREAHSDLTLSEPHDCSSTSAS
jgi:integrase